MRKYGYWIPVGVAVALMLGVANHAASTTAQPVEDQKAPKIVVGTYDSRAIAVAWVRSPYCNIGDKMKELEDAKAAGDEKRVAELEAWGPEFQQRLHFQGFGRAPVTEYLEQVNEELPGLAGELGVDVIAFDCNYTGDNVETVDITLELVKLFSDSPETIKTVTELCTHAPVPLEELANHED